MTLSNGLAPIISMRGELVQALEAIADFGDTAADRNGLPEQCIEKTVDVVVRCLADTEF